MRITVSTAVSCAREAVQDFRFYEYLPFGAILALQIVFLILAVNLGAPWGMATAGWLATQFGGDKVLHYPQFFLFLPNLAVLVEIFLYGLAGCVLIPLAVARIMEPTDRALQAPGAIGIRVRRAALPVLAGAFVSLALLTGWQALLPMGPAGLIRGFAGGGLQGETALWITGMLISYAVSTCFLCVPVVAIQEGRGFVRSLVDGVRRSVGMFPFIYAFVLLFSLPALIALYVTQVFGTLLVIQMRPEVSAVLLLVYAILINLATYLLYAATTRLLLASRQEAE